MKRKLALVLAAVLLLGSVSALPLAAYVRISYGTDCLAGEAELVKTALRGTPFRFSEADFKGALGLSRVDAITVLSLPPAADGVLKLGDSAVLCGQVISRSEMEQLFFYPADEKFEKTSFKFCSNTTSGTTALTCTLRAADAINKAPTAGEKPSSLSVTTQKGIAVYGEMSASDPEGDAITYFVIDYPDRGTLTLADKTSGEFCYLPKGETPGEDSFTYVARDEYGNYSYPVTVTVKITARNTARVYADLDGHSAHHAALVLAEKNIMLGAIEGDGMYFYPDKTLTRGEFLVMAMKAAGIAPAAGVTKTWFDDDDKIPATIKKYVATAALYGYVNGSFDGTGLYFHPEREVTRAEAAVMMNAILSVRSPEVRPVFADAKEIPVWARESVYALHEAGIFSTAEGNSISAGKPLSRADAAEALYAMMNYRG